MAKFVKLVRSDDIQTAVNPDHVSRIMPYEVNDGIPRTILSFRKDETLIIKGNFDEVTRMLSS